MKLISLKPLLKELYDKFTHILFTVKMEDNPIPSNLIFPEMSPLNHIYEQDLLLRASQVFLETTKLSPELQDQFRKQINRMLYSQDDDIYWEPQESEFPLVVEDDSGHKIRRLQKNRLNFDDGDLFGISEELFSMGKRQKKTHSVANQALLKNVENK